MSYAPFSNDSTSWLAAQSVVLSARTDEARVYRFIRNRGDRGATDEEVELTLGMLANNSRARRRGLVIKALVHDSGYRRNTRSGRAAIVWRASGEPADPDTPRML